jgi:hypothetical protein
VAGDPDSTEPSPLEGRRAESEEGPTLPPALHEEIEVTSRGDAMLGLADSAGEGVVGRLDLERRPLLRPGELLETVPGMVTTQHSGGGKANQYFLRGMNLDHGTDFRITVGGVPVNFGTHAHGQGYSDLSFLIPELVESVRFRKGPHSAEEGDFSAAGAARLEYVRALPAPLAEVAGGEDGYGRALLAGSTGWAGGELLGAVETATTDGPWRRPENLRRTNGLLRWTAGDDGRRLGLTLMAYEGQWDATDQVPRQLLAEGELDSFDTLDPTTGGSSRRVSLSLEAERTSGRSLSRLGGYLLHYDLDLFSNFTYFLDDPVRGDQFEQADRRRGAGVHGTHELSWAPGGRAGSLLLGFDARLERIDAGLFHTQRRRRLSTTRHDDVLQLSGGPFAEARVRWTPWLRTTTGLRLDGWRAEVASDLEANSGTESDLLLSPKLGLVLGPWAGTELYVNAGYGFHSNDARGATVRVDPHTGEPAARVDPLVRARGLDVGVRNERLDAVRSSLTLFLLDFDSELLFVGDAGGTEATRPSRRVGLELTNAWLPRPWLRLEADLSLARARFRDGDPAGDRIPGAVERVGSAALLLGERGEGTRWPERLSGGLRLRYLGPRSLREDGAVRAGSSALLYAEAGYRLAAGVRIGLEAYNLLDRRTSDIEYWYESRPSPGAGAREDVHLHPAEPRTLRLVLSWRR